MTPLCGTLVVAEEGVANFGWRGRGLCQLAGWRLLRSLVAGVGRRPFAAALQVIDRVAGREGASPALGREEATLGESAL